MKQVERSARSRASLIDAALRLLGTEGYSGLTNTRLEALSGVSRGLVGYHFGGKQGLLEAVIGSVSADFMRGLVEPQEVLDLPGLDAVIRVMDSYLRALALDPTRNQAMIVLIAESTRDLPELQQPVRALNETLRGGLRHHLERGVEDGSVKATTSPHDAATLLAGILRGITLQWLADPDAIDIDHARAEAARIIGATYAAV